MPAASVSGRRQHLVVDALARSSHHDAGERRVARRVLHAVAVGVAPDEVADLKVGPEAKVDRLDRRAVARRSSSCLGRVARGVLLAVRVGLGVAALPRRRAPAGPRIARCWSLTDTMYCSPGRSECSSESKLVQAGARWSSSSRARRAAAVSSSTVTLAMPFSPAVLHAVAVGVEPHAVAKRQARHKAVVVRQAEVAVRARRTAVSSTTVDAGASSTPLESRVPLPPTWRRSAAGRRAARR
jgi:hypothetical protein